MINLVELKNINIGAISACKNPGTKYHSLYLEIINSTKFLPNDTLFTNRVKYVLQQLTQPKLCECGCGAILQNPDKKFIFGHHNKSNEVKLKKQKTMQTKYGVDNPSQLPEVKLRKQQTCLRNNNALTPFQSKKVQDKIKKTNLRKYGVENPASSNNIKNKIKQTNAIKYGMHPMQTTEVKQKREATLIAKYGRHPMQTEASLEKMRNTNQSIYGVDYPIAHQKHSPSKSQLIKIKHSRRKTVYERLKTNINVAIESSLDDFIEHGSSYDWFYDWKCLKCNKTFKKFYYGYVPFCPFCKPKSRPEVELFEFLQQFDSNLRMHDRSTIAPFELDIHSAKHRIAIEYDGLHWHSELSGTDRKYHLMKTTLCAENNIRLIHVFEDEWLHKQDIVKSRLRNLFNATKTKVYARKCVVRQIDSKCKTQFLETNHIQGNAASSVNLGLFHNNELVSVMTFSKLRIALGQKSKKNCWELSRFCSCVNLVVVGGANKLLRFFEREFSPKEIVSYADRRWSDGGVYEKLGFELTHASSPNYWYFLDKHRFHRFNFRKNVLKDKLKQFDESKSEWGNMVANNFDRIWDCGNFIFKKECK